MSPRFPIFRLTEAETSCAQPKLVGSLDSTRFGPETWVDDRYLGYLKRNEIFVPGRWHRVAGHWEFVLQNPSDVDRLVGVSEFEVLDGYWGERAELVLGTSIRWAEAVWPGDHGQEHDHCGICWATIMDRDNREHYRASTGERVCMSCYREFVQRRNLGFIVPSGRR